MSSSNASNANNRSGITLTLTRSEALMLWSVIKSADIHHRHLDSIREKLLRQSHKFDPEGSVTFDDAETADALVPDGITDPPKHTDIERNPPPLHIRAEIARLDGENYRPYDIVRRLGVPRSTVDRYSPSEASRKPRSKGSIHITDRRCTAIRACRMDGMDFRDIADVVGCNPATVMCHSKGKCSCDADLPPPDAASDPTDQGGVVR